MKWYEIALGGVALLGLVLLVYGSSMPAFSGELTVEGPIEESSVDDEDVTEYENLAAENRDLFDSALANDGSVSYTEGDFNAEVVVHDGQYYRTSIWGGENGHRLWTILAGWVVTGLGAIGIACLVVGRYWDGRKSRTAQ